MGYAYEMFMYSIMRVERLLICVTILNLWRFGFMQQTSVLVEESVMPDGEFVDDFDAAQVAIVGEGVGFERKRRITGYLVGTMNRWNNAKRAEEHDRVKHSMHSVPCVCC